MTKHTTLCGNRWQSMDLAKGDHVCIKQDATGLAFQWEDYAKKLEVTNKAKNDEILKLKALIVAAVCPCCNGSGSYHGDHGEQVQCQWCYETKEIRSK